MSDLKILIFPDPKLRKVAKKIEKFDKSLELLAQNMLITMYEAEGIGLAATQIDVHIRLVVMDLSEERNEPRVFVNPEYTILDKSPFTYEEGCLSIPGFNEEISRPSQILLKWQDLQGNFHEDRPDGIFTVCAQHEIDHLDGKLFVDYLSPIKRDRIRKKLENRRN
ncbi:MAG: peptide deformylase [Gammaproteobacteria bacterium]